MKASLFLALGVLALASAQSDTSEKFMSPEEARERLESDVAALIDVREPEEWEDGVVEGAILLPLSDLKGERRQWRAVLEAVRDKQLILYCRTGNRSGQAARILEDEGYDVANAGGLRDWEAADQPIVPPE